MATRQFESVEEIDGHYKRRLAKMEDESEAPAIREEWLTAKNDFLQGQLAATTIRQARMDAVMQFPDVAEWRDELQGSTAEEVLAHAEKIHKRLEAMKPPEPPAPPQPDPAQAAYGRPAAGGAAEPVDTTSEDEALKQRVLGRLQRGDGLQDSQGKMDATRFGSIRIREALDQARSNPTFKPSGERRR